jgi:hypothetical protein
MKKITLTLVFLVACLITARSQEIKKETLIGKWKVVKVVTHLEEVVPKESLSKIGEMEDAFLKSSFEFKADGNFNFNINLKDFSIKNAHWKFDAASNSVIVQEWKDKDKPKPMLLELNIQKVGDKIIFIPMETFTELEVKKE